METKIIKPCDNSFKTLKEQILNNNPVVFPTDTVYGIGVDAFSDEGAQNIFKIKGRPENKPIPLLISKNYPLENLVEEINDNAKILIKHFWPGALTLIFKLKANLSKYVTCGFSTVAVRIPNDKNAQKLLEFYGYPLATTSANISGNKSPISSLEAKFQLDGLVNYILDGGICLNKQESTIVDVTSNEIKILREGAIPKEKIFIALKSSL